VVDYMVEIGGEVRAKGKNQSGRPWTIGVSTPDPNAQSNDLIAQFMVDGSVATSGNYRNYYEFQGQKFGHTLDPKTGFPAVTNMLSATVFHPSCAIADAYATGFMSMGYEKAIHFVSKIDDIEYLFIYADENNLLKKVNSSGVYDMMKTTSEN
ncbi:MAG: FAD:protein FMN transferase, partial [Bacteroidota bacterium]